MATLNMDTFRFADTEMFLRMRECLPAGEQTMRNILGCSKELLFAWDLDHSALLVSAQRHRALNHNVLVPSTPIGFMVGHVLPTSDGTQVALSGYRGIAVMEMPTACAQSASHARGSAFTACRCTSLDEELFLRSPALEVQQVRWHQDLSTGLLLLVLFSDSTMRVYAGENVRCVWTVGSVAAKISEIANRVVVGGARKKIVDFVIAPSVEVCHTKGTEPDDSNVLEILEIDGLTDALSCDLRTEWPILLLQCNGDIFVLLTDFVEQTSRIEGPLMTKTELWRAEASDFCSLMVLPMTPPTVVLAEASGRLHHAMLLGQQNVLEDCEELNRLPDQWYLHVLEDVNLMLDGNQPPTTIYLQPDLSDPLRYYAYHGAGVHTIYINALSPLKKFLQGDTGADLSFLAVPSTVVYLVHVKDFFGEGINEVVGFTLMEQPAGLLILLGTGQVITIERQKVLSGLKEVEEVQSASPSTSALPKLPSPSSQSVTPKKTRGLTVGEMERCEQVENLELERQAITNEAIRLGDTFSTISYEQLSLSAKLHNAINNTELILHNCEKGDKFRGEITKFKSDTKTLQMLMKRSNDALMYKQLPGGPVFNNFVGMFQKREENIHNSMSSFGKDLFRQLDAITLTKKPPMQEPE